MRILLYRIFGHTENARQSDIVYVNWLSLCHAAVRGIEMFSPASNEWKQAHSQARFVILQVNKVSSTKINQQSRQSWYFKEMGIGTL